MIRFPYPRNHPVYTTWPGNTAAIFEPSVASMSIPFRNVFVPKRGLTCGPYSATTRPSAGQESRPRSAANPVAGRRRCGPARGRPLRPRPPLLLLQVSDEGLEPPGGLGELAHHPIVVGPLVLNFRQQGAALRRFLVDLPPFLLRLGLERRQLLAPRLHPALAIGQN